MKYFLSTAGKKCCKDCTWLLSLAKQENGYDLIQIKRGFSQNRNLMKLYPGEPAIILDTGEFYIGDATGRPILINPSGGFVLPNSGNIICVEDKSEWAHGSQIVIPYEDMITSDGVQPEYANDGVYSCAVIIDEASVPVGIAFKLDWNYSESSALFMVGYFNQDKIVEFTESDIDAIIHHAEMRLLNQNP